MHSPMHGGAPGGGMVHPGPMGNSMEQMQHPMLAPVGGGGGGAGGGTPQQAQQQQQQGVAGTELYAMDYESLGSAASGTFHPIAPSALHFGPFAPQFSSQVHLTP